MEELKALVLRAQGGDGEAYDRLVGRFREMAVAYAYSILGDHQLAEDARQEAFIGAYCDLMALREPAAFPGWFRRLVQKHAVDLRRGRREILVPIDQLPEAIDAGPDPAREAERNEVRERVHRAIDALPEHESQVTRLHYIEGLSLKEIAARLGIAAQTVKSRLHTARGRLRLELTEMAKERAQKPDPDLRRQLREAASDEAIGLFDRELSDLLGERRDRLAREALDLLCAKGRLQRFMGRYDKALETFREAMEEDLIDERPLARARLRAEIGLTLVQTGDYGDARRELNSARRSIARQPEMAPLRSAVINALGMCAWGEGDFSNARQLYRQAHEAARKADCPELEAETLNNLGLVEWRTGRNQKALEAFRRVRDDWKRLKNRFGQAVSLMNLGILEEQAGRIALARRHYDNALKLSRGTGFRQAQAACLTNLASLALGRDQWQDALHKSAEAVDIARAIGDRRSEAIALENLALAHSGRQAHEEAREALDRAQTIAQSLGDRDRHISLGLTDVELRQRAATPPRDLLKTLGGLARRFSGGRFAAERPRLLRLRAELEWAAGNRSRARDALKEALTLCKRRQCGAERKRLEALKKEWTKA